MGILHRVRLHAVLSPCGCAFDAVHKFERDGGAHNQKVVPDETWSELCKELRVRAG